jgi:hypothetical protein
MDWGWWYSRTDLNIDNLLEICIVWQWSLLHIFGEITSLSSGFCRFWSFLLQSALCDIIISSYSEGIVSFIPRINFKIWRDTGEDLRGYETFMICGLKQWELIYCACSAICDRTLLYLKVPRLCLLVLLVRVVCSWRQEWIVGGMVVTGENWNAREKKPLSLVLKMVLQANPYFWNLEFLHSRFASFAVYVVHELLHSEFVYYVFTIIHNIEYIDIRIHTQHII